MQMHVAATFANVHELRGRSGNLDSINCIETMDAEWCTGSPLASEAVARDNQF